MYVYGGCIYKFVTICELVFVYDQFCIAAKTHWYVCMSMAVVFIFVCVFGLTCRFVFVYD